MEFGGGYLVKSFNLHLLFALSFLSACGVETATNTIATNIPSTENFQVDVNTSSEYEVVISKNGDGATECLAEEDQDILCIVDMYEMDMYMRGYTINVAFEPEMCKYYGFYPYFFNNVPVGPAPTRVYYNANDDGDIIDPAHFSLPTGTLGVTNDIYYFVPHADGTAGEWYSHADLFGTKATSDGDVQCVWDYETDDDDYPNCCDGDYTLYTVEDGTLADQRQSWGGKLGNCFWGPGIKDYPNQGGALDSHNLPEYTLAPVDSSEGAVLTFKVSSPDSQIAVVGYGQVYAANYYKSSDHSGVPEATRVISSIYGGFQYLANSSAHFQYDCYDQAMEVKARIRVVGREWNDYTQFLAFLTGSISASAADAAANVGGRETTPEQDPDDTSSAPELSYVNDFADWKDVSEHTNIDDDEMSFPQYLCVGVGGTRACADGSSSDYRTAPAEIIYGGSYHDDYWGFIIEED